jgi:hypothetical protein
MAVLEPIHSHHEKANTVTTESEFSNDENDNDADREADAMKAALNKQVAAWSKQRDGATGETGATLSQPAPVRARRSSETAKKAAAAPAAPKPAETSSRPFSMSYDGQTQSDYLKGKLDRKSR